MSSEKVDCLIPAAVTQNPQIGRSCTQYDKILLLLSFFVDSLRDGCCMVKKKNLSKHMAEAWKLSAAGCVHLVSEYNMSLINIASIESAEAVRVLNRSRATSTAWRSWGREESLASGTQVNWSSLFVYIHWNEVLPK